MSGRGHDDWRAGTMPRMDFSVTPGSLLAKHLGHPIRLTVADGDTPTWELTLRRDGSARLLIGLIRPLTEVRGRWRLLESEAAHYVVRLLAKQVSGPHTTIGARLWQDLNGPLCLHVTAEETIAEAPCPPGSEVEPVATSPSGPRVGNLTPSDYPRLVLGSWLEHHFGFKSDFIYFERFTFFADGAALREQWAQVDQLEDDEKHDYVAVRGTYQLVQQDELRFEPDAPGAETVTLKVRPNIWPSGDIHLELALATVPGGAKRFDRERPTVKRPR